MQAMFTTPHGLGGINPNWEIKLPNSPFPTYTPLPSAGGASTSTALPFIDWSKYTLPATPVYTSPVYTSVNPGGIAKGPSTFDKIASIVASVIPAFATNPAYRAAQSTTFAQTQAGNTAVSTSEGLGADAGANVGAAVGNVGDQISGFVQRHPLGVLLGVGAVGLYFIQPGSKRR